MTTFVAWVGVDSRGTASINFATDSRISWGPSGETHWDMARKTFSSNSSPDIFGYVNDVIFPSMVLGQIVNAIDNGGLFGVNDSCETRFIKVAEHIKNSHELYPPGFRESFCIFHGAREGAGLQAEFKLNTIAWNKKQSTWSVDSLSIPIVSSAIKIDGSGARVVGKWSERWKATSQGGTSRAVFSSFCNAIYSGEDKLSSGAPQLVSLYRKGFGKTIGFIENRKKFISGIEIINSSETSDEEIEWRNRYFERCDALGDLINGAQKHHVPKGLS